ncbi:hypothetical protein, partial [Paenibacillus sp. MCAF9]|uniref:hypothetical protein n=1 Tax=Paenibacillus sp. MCAF9 TaxID=3233046 RepID=UPI003F9C31D1
GVLGCWGVGVLGCWGVGVLGYWGVVSLVKLARTTNGHRFRYYGEYSSNSILTDIRYVIYVD